MIKTLINFTAVPPCPFLCTSSPSQSGPQTSTSSVPLMDLLPDPVQAKENLLTSTSAASTSASCLPCLIFLVTTSLYAPSFSISPPCCSTQVPHLIQRSSVLCRLAFAPVLSRPNLHLSGCSSSCSLLSLRITMSSANIIVHRVSFLTPPDEQEGAQGSSLEHTSTLNPPRNQKLLLGNPYYCLSTSPYFSHFFISL